MKNKNEIKLLVEFFQVKDKNKMICKSQECKLSIVQDNLEKNQYSILCKNEDYQEENKNEKNWREMKFPITKNLYICQFCNLFIQYFLWKFKGILYLAKILIDDINKNTNIFIEYIIKFIILNEENIPFYQNKVISKEDINVYFPNYGIIDNIPNFLNEYLDIINQKELENKMIKFSKNISRVESVINPYQTKKIFSAEGKLFCCKDYKLINCFDRDFLTTLNVYNLYFEKDIFILSNESLTGIILLKKYYSKMPNFEIIPSIKNGIIFSNFQIYFEALSENFVFIFEDKYSFEEFIFRFKKKEELEINQDNINMNNYSNNKINESNIFINNNNIDLNHKKYNNKKNALNYKTPNYDPIKITQSLRENSNLSYNNINDFNDEKEEENYNNEKEEEKQNFNDERNEEIQNSFDLSKFNIESIISVYNEFTNENTNLSVENEYNNLNINTQENNKFSFQNYTYNQIYCVTENNRINVYHPNEINLTQIKSLTPIKNSLGNNININQMNFFNKGINLLFLDNNNPNVITNYDLIKNKIVNEWNINNNNKIKCIYPQKKFDQLTENTLFYGITSKSMFLFDGRLKEGKINEEKKYESNYNFNYISSGKNGQFAISSEKGDVRIFNKIDKATNLFSFKKEFINAIDISNNGNYILITCNNYLIFINVLGKNKLNGFYKRLINDKRNEPIYLKLNDNDLKQYDLYNVKFANGKFSINDENENDIICSVGKYLVIWKFNSGKYDKYKIIEMEDIILSIEFRYMKNQIIVTMPKTITVYNHIYDSF